MSKLENLKKKVAQKRKKMISKGERTALGVLNETGISRPYHRILTGILPLDYLLQGLKPGTLLEFSGEENAGKTTLLWKIIENVQNIYKSPAILNNDVEGTSNDEKFLDRFPLLNRDDIIYDSESKIENFFNKIEEFIDDLDVVIIDSIAAMSSVNERDLEKADMGKTAQIWSRGWKRLYDFSKSGAVFLAINQVRENLDPYASTKNGTQTTGGRALRHAKSAQIHLKKEGKAKALKKTDFKGDEEITAWLTLIEVQKNKQGSAFKTIPTYLWCDDDKPETFDAVTDAVNFGINYGIIERNSAKGSFFTFKNILTGEEIIKINGRTAVDEYFYSNPLHLAILTIYVYRYMYNDKFFYCLWDKILLIAKTLVITNSKKYNIELNFTAEDLLDKLKKDYPIQNFLDEESYSKLNNQYGSPWTWGILGGFLSEEE